MQRDTAREAVRAASTLGGLLAWHAEARPGHVASIYEGRITTYSQLDQFANRFARAICESGIRPESCVAYIGRNTDIVFATLTGCAKVGVAYLSINYRLTALEIGDILNDADPRLILAESSHVDKLVQAQHACSRTAPIICVNKPLGVHHDAISWCERF